VAPITGLATEVREVTGLITPGPAEALAGLLGVTMPDLAIEGLPLLWHWVYLLDRPLQTALGPDGHPARGGMPSPPASGLRRMFAGGRASRHGPLRAGTEATRRTWQASSKRKQGRSGPLHFITVRTQISQGERVVLTEEQDLVYREPGQAAAGPARAAPDHELPAHACDWPVDVGPVLLFRFSALTYNAHRIHYDRDYCRDVEGYPGLLTHGPLQAIAMAEAARAAGLAEGNLIFEYRLVSPLFDYQGLIVRAVPGPDGVNTSVRDRYGRQTATGTLTSG